MTLLAAVARADDPPPPSVYPAGSYPAPPADAPGAGKPSGYTMKVVIRGEAVDEAKSGRTLRGTPVTPRTDQCFPAEPRDLFWKMDMVPNLKTGVLEPLDFDEDGDGQISDEADPELHLRNPLNKSAERDAIRGRNTWLLWGGGNEIFWSWLHEQGYGLTDFLILMDSRRRGSRFKSAGLVNQPGFETSLRPFLGLYLDTAKADGSALLRPPPGPGLAAAPAANYLSGVRPEPERYDAQGRKLAEPVERPAPPSAHYTQLFEPWTTPAQRAEEWSKQSMPGDDPYKDFVPETVRKRLAQDGLDPAVYGYPSGIFGLRLLLNPDFFGPTKAAAKARTYWKERVEMTNGRYYSETGIHADPKLIRPFRVSMACGFCHVAAHPLNPPRAPENPA